MLPKSTSRTLVCLLLSAGVQALGRPADGHPASEPPGDTSDLEALLRDPVVTTASRNPERASAAPATVYTITAAEMIAGGVRTVDEALEMLGLGLYVGRSRDYVTGIDVGAQGLLFRDSGRHVLVMLDGMILNSPGTGRISINEAIGVPLELIDRIEVMLGPGSVHYGSNAMLAVINLVTKRASDLGSIQASAELGTAVPQDDEGSPTTAAGARAGFRYRLSLGTGQRFRVLGTEGELTVLGEWTQEWSASYEVTPFSTANAGNHSFLPGQTTWGGHASHTLQAPSGVLSVRLGDLRLLINGFGYARTMPLVGTFNDPDTVERQGGLRVDLSHVWQEDPRVALRTRLYGGHTEFSERSSYGEPFWCLPEQPDGCHFEMSARSQWAGLEQELTGDWILDGTLVTTIGYDARVRWFDGTSSIYHDLGTDAAPTDLAVPHASSTTRIGALFAQQIWRPLSWLSLNAGARLDLDGQYGTRTSPRFALVVTPGSAPCCGSRTTRPSARLRSTSSRSSTPPTASRRPRCSRRPCAASSSKPSSGSAGSACPSVDLARCTRTSSRPASRPLRRSPRSPTGSLRRPTRPWWW